MPSYPSAIFNPPARSNGQTIDASHVGNLQDEVVAVETALKNGIAHNVTISTGGLTVSTGPVIMGGNLSVAKDSTLAGLNVTSTATFASSVTFAGNVEITGALLVGGSPVGPAPVVRLSHSADQAIPNGTFLGLNWDTEVRDSTNQHSTASNSSRLNLTSSGAWMIGANVPWAAGAATDNRVRLVLNDATPIAGTVDAAQSNMSMPLATLYYTANTTDWVTVQVLSNGSTGTVHGADSTYGGAAFWAYKVG